VKNSPLERGNMQAKRRSLVCQARGVFEYLRMLPDRTHPFPTQVSGCFIPLKRGVSFSLFTFHSNKTLQHTSQVRDNQRLVRPGRSQPGGAGDHRAAAALAGSVGNYGFFRGIGTGAAFGGGYQIPGGDPRAAEAYGGGCAAVAGEPDQWETGPDHR
jgi:hypothetical protein